MKRLLITTVILHSSFFILHSAPAADLRELAFQVAVPAKTAMKVDGVLDETCWKTAPKHSDYYEYLKPSPRRVTNTKTDCMIVYDEKGVYTGIINWEDHPEKLKKNCVKNFDASIWTDDCGEIYYDPDASGVGYYKFTVNCLGKFETDWRMDLANIDRNWTAPGIESAAKIFDDRWEMELFIPWSAFHNRPAPAAGDVWTFNHSRFRFGALGWGQGFSTSAPGGSGITADKFGYLYFSDGAAPDPKKVLDILEKRLSTLWGISIDGKVYVHDLTGTHVSNLDDEQRALVKTFTDAEKSLEPRIAAAKRDDLAKELAKLHAVFTNELAKYDSSFAAVKQFADLAEKIKAMNYDLKVGEIGDLASAAEPLEMPLAGKYDLNPPKVYRGHNGWFRHNRIKNAYVTPHLDWGSAALGMKPAHPLFFTGFGGTFRDAVEIEERFEFDDPLYHPGGFGASGPYEDPISHGTALDKQAQLETLLAKNPDVVVFDGFAFARVPSRYRYEILRRVRDEGVGLCLFGCDAGKALTAKLAHDLKAEKDLVQRIAYPQFPGASAKSFRISCFEFGKGRILQCDLKNPGPWSLEWKAGYESRSAFEYSCIRWAQGADAEAAVTFATGAQKDEFGVDAALMAFEVDVGKSDVNQVRMRLRTVENEVLKDETVAVKGGRNVLAVDVRDVAAGSYYLDVIPQAKATIGGVKSDVPAVHPFSKASKLGKLTIAGTNVTVVAEGTDAKIQCRWDVRAVRDGVLKWELYDNPYRQLRAKGEVPFQAGATGATAVMPTKKFPTLCGVVKAKVVYADGEEVVAAAKPVFFPNHRFPDYTMIIWESMYEQGMHELLAPQCVDVMGYDCHLGESGSLSAVFNGRAVPYITRVMLGRNKEGGVSWADHVLPIRRGTKEEKAKFDELKKNVNVYRPEIRKAIEEGFGDRVKKTVNYGVSVWNLGDECHYSDEIGCGVKEDEVYFQKFLKERYGTVEKFNQAHGTACKSFEEAPHKLCKDANAQGDWPAWLDQKAYSARMYADTFRLLQDIIHRYDPKARVGAEGSEAGQLEDTVRTLEFWGPYGDFYKDEILRSLKPDSVRGMWWGGYMGDPRNGFPGHQWEFLLSGRANADEWFAAMPGTTHSCFAGDFSLAPYVRKMHKNHAQLKHGLASFMIRTPLRKDPFAIYYSWPSEMAGQVLDEFPIAADGARPFVRHCYKLGYETSFITEKTLAKLGERKMLFLFGACALSDQEVNAFKAFVQKGGKLVSDCEPGVLDQYLARRREAPLKGLWVKFDRGNLEAEADRCFGIIGFKRDEKVTPADMKNLMVRTRVLGDMKAVGFTTLARHCGGKATVDFGSKGFIYEVDEGYVGESDRVEIAALDKPFKLYAQFKEMQDAPKPALSKTAVAAGDFVTLDVTALRKGGVYRLEVAGPDGKVIPNREIVFTVDGRPVEFQFPFNDAAGEYTVSLRDVATGLVGTTGVEVK